MLSLSCDNKLRVPVFDQAFQTFLLRRLCHGLFWQPVMLTGADL